MITRAPGKIVISGAYSVLEGATAIVAAVDRYAIADSQRTAEWLTPEVLAAGLHCKPWFDASALRGENRKLGLGSSAAILVASIAADLAEDDPSMVDQALAQRVAPRALAAHSAVQPHGSGIDVISSCFGGIRSIRRSAGQLEHHALNLPLDLHIQIWTAPHSQSTHAMLSRLAEFKAQQPARYDALIGDQASAAEFTAGSLAASDIHSFLIGIDRQRQALTALGNSVGIPIITEEVRDLAECAAKDSAVVIPAGAGGGDIAIFVSASPPSAELLALATQVSYTPLTVTLGARGVHSLGNRC